MPKHQYVQQPYKVIAEQYFAATDPPPPLVCHCTITPVFPTGDAHVHTLEGLYAPVDGDWIVEDQWTPHAVHLLSDAEFSDRFGGAVAE
jgi:hypothetical protein